MRRPPLPHRPVPARVRVPRLRRGRGSAGLGLRPARRGRREAAREPSGRSGGKRLCSSHVSQRQVLRLCHTCVRITPPARCLVEVAGEGAQAAVGGGADGAGSFAQEGGGAGGVQAEDGAQEQGLGLVGAQGGDEADGGGGGEGVDGGAGGVVCGGEAGEVFGGDGDGRGAAGVAGEGGGGAGGGGGGGPAAGGGGGGRVWRRRWSRARWRAMVAAQPRKASWLPWKVCRSRAMCSQVSEAMSSASSPVRACR